VVLPLISQNLMKKTTDISVEKVLLKKKIITTPKKEKNEITTPKKEKNEKITFNNTINNEEKKFNNELKTVNINSKLMSKTLEKIDKEKDKEKDKDKDKENT